MSRAIRSLRQRLNTDGPAAVDSFWTEVERSGTPLLEPVAGDPNNTLVTFLWRGAPETKAVQVLVMGLGQGALERLGSSSVWYATFTVRNDYRLAYGLRLMADGGQPAPLQGDPLNRSVPVTMLGPSPWSVADLPKAKPVPWIVKQPNVRAGSMEERQIESSVLTNEPLRKVWIYAPAGYDRGGATSYGAVIFMDGEDYRGPIGAATILDNLVAAKRIPPLVGVFIEHGSAASAAQDLDNHGIFVDFLAKELIPWLRQQWHVTSDPSRVILCGASRGGLGAAFAAYRRPDLFGNVLSESGAFWRGDEGANEPHEWLTKQFQNSPKLPIRFFFSVGTWETIQSPTNTGRGDPTFIAANRHLWSALQSKGYVVEQHETPGGHDPLHWRSVLPDGLIFLAGK